MKIVFSRKGFDWANGGTPSPVLPDGTMLSMPIPSNDSIRLSELKVNGIDYAKIMSQLCPKYSDYFMNLSCHLDPDIRKNNRTLPEGWVPAFGQIDAAETHLENQNIKEGDLFIFFGWFGKTEIKNGKLHYVSKQKDKHMMFGYMQIGKISKGEDCLKYYWHPHCYVYGNNTIYEASKKLCFDGEETELPGYGVFRYSEEVVLTKDGETRSRWELPEFFKEINISCHSKESFRNGYFQTVRIGQEFVVSEDDRVTEWAKKLIINNIDYES